MEVLWPFQRVFVHFQAKKLTYLLLLVKCITKLQESLVFQTIKQATAFRASRSINTKIFKKAKMLTIVDFDNKKIFLNKLIIGLAQDHTRSQHSIDTCAAATIL